MLNPEDYLDPDFEIACDTMAKPRWYVVRIVGNNSRIVIAMFDEEGEQEACKLCESDKNLKLIPCS